MGIKTRNAIRLTASYITLVIIAIGCIYLALWIVLASFRPESHCTARL